MRFSLSSSNFYIAVLDLTQRSANTPNNELDNAGSAHLIDASKQTPNSPQQVRACTIWDGDMGNALLSYYAIRHCVYACICACER